MNARRWGEVPGGASLISSNTQEQLSFPVLSLKAMGTWCCLTALTVLSAALRTSAHCPEFCQKTHWQFLMSSVQPAAEPGFSIVVDVLHPQLTLTKTQLNPREGEETQSGLTEHICLGRFHSKLWRFDAITFLKINNDWKMRLSSTWVIGVPHTRHKFYEEEESRYKVKIPGQQSWHICICTQNQCTDEILGGSLNELVLLFLHNLYYLWRPLRAHTVFREILCFLFVLELSPMVSGWIFMHTENMKENGSLKAHI